jgi:hypothetical protein
MFSQKNKMKTILILIKYFSASVKHFYQLSALAFSSATPPCAWSTEELSPTCGRPALLYPLGHMILRSATEAAESGTRKPATVAERKLNFPNADRQHSQRIEHLCIVPPSLK